MGSLGNLAGKIGAYMRPLPFRRTVALAVRGFFQDQGLHRASALAFDSVLGLIPCLAFLVSAMKGFGAYQALMRDTIRPGIVRMMTAMGGREEDETVGLLGIFLKVLDLVEQASFGTLGTFGLVLLFYIVALLMVSVEQTMNHIFGVERPRSLIRRITDYSSILFIAPICTILAAGAASGAERLAWMKSGVVLQSTAALVMSIALTVLYLVMPCRRIRLVSALLGGVAAGIIWYAVLVVHVHFQIGVARYNALYSTFAAIPVFLVWVFVSWIVVLLGAELAAAHDKPELFAFRIRGREIDHGSRLFIVFSAFAAMGRRAVLGQPPATLGQLATELSLPIEMLRAELERFLDRELLVRSLGHGEPRYVITRDLAAITVGELLQLVEEASPPLEPMGDAEAWLRGFLRERVLTRPREIASMTVRDLVEATEVSAPSKAAEIGG
jgi:membrane protein